MTEAFQLSFKILVFLFCRHKVKYNCCKFLFLFLKIELFISMFVEQGVAKAKITYLGI